MSHTEQHRIFWKLYPKRNGKKIGKTDCRLWFEKHRPSPEIFSAICAWLKIWVANDEICRRKKEFHASLPDPIRFLKRVMWEDDIEPLRGKKKGKSCSLFGCDNASRMMVGNSGFCSLSHRKEKLGW